MTAVDVAVIGAPFLDLTFEGLERLPAAGEEIVARALHATPGGTAIQAIGVARLGLSSAIVAPRPTDPMGALLGSMLDAEDVAWLGGDGDATSVTAVLAAGPRPGMASALGASEPTLSDVAAVDARAVIASLGRVTLVPAGRTIYATSGPFEVQGDVGRVLPNLERVEAVIVNEAEAEALSGTSGDDALSELRRLGGATVVVTRGPRGAVASDGVSTIAAPALDVAEADATGAGDLFVATFVWASLRGLELADRVAWATLAAGLSVRAPTALDGAPYLQDLLEQGRRRGLTA
jgi:ribokinase